MNSINYLTEINKERENRIKGRLAPDPNAILLWNIAINGIQNFEKKEKLIKAFNFAKEIEYKHEGLSKDIYFAHPVRVAALSLLSQRSININCGLIGLLHNIFELSDIPFDLISKKFGKFIANQIKDLTVNRQLQYDKIYKNDYYKKINSNPLECRIVKIFDKIDNIFLLDLNPDEEIKIKYLTEIELYILPMVERDIPVLYNYLLKMIEYYQINNLNKRYES
jgi:(p)ppGpp synthase/HD superfamily hydrolase